MKTFIAILFLFAIFPLSAVMNMHKKARPTLPSGPNSEEPTIIPSGAMCKDDECANETKTMGSASGTSSVDEEKDCETLKKYYEKSQNQKTPEAYNKPLLVKFSASWCPPCQLMKEAMNNLVDESKFEILHINYDECEMVSVFKINAIPQLYRFENSSEMKDKKVPANHFMRGYSPAKAEALKELLSK